MLPLYFKIGGTEESLRGPGTSPGGNVVPESAMTWDDGEPMTWDDGTVME